MAKISVAWAELVGREGTRRVPCPDKCSLTHKTLAQK